MTENDQAEPGDGKKTETNPEGGNEAPSEGGAEGGSEEQPDIEGDEQAEIPDGLADIDPDEVEEAAGASSEESDDQEETDEGEGNIADPGESSSMSTGSSPVQAGNLYVSVVKSVTNAQIEKYGGPDAQELGDDHFEQYDLANHFDATMDELGVGSDMEPHEALLLATVLSVGDGLVTETDVLDQQIGRLMDKAMNGNGGAAA
jgi:hypothetical protein